MATNEYGFVTEWSVRGRIEEAFDIIDNACDLPRWWPAVYLDAQEIEQGDARGIGKVVALHTRGWLPYTLRWHFRVAEKTRPQRIVLDAWGDFNGRALLTFKQNQEQAVMNYDWRIRADKPLLRYGSFLFKPIFAANHHWAMRIGRISLEKELRRRAGGRD